MVVDAQQPDPALLTEGQRDEAAKLDELGLGEVLVQALPERVVGVQPPSDRLGVRKGSFLTVVVQL